VCCVARGRVGRYSVPVRVSTTVTKSQVRREHYCRGEAHSWSRPPEVTLCSEQKATETMCMEGESKIQFVKNYILLLIAFLLNFFYFDFLLTFEPFLDSFV
jgi:hypothetical protein